MAYLASKVASIPAHQVADDPVIAKILDEFLEVLAPSFDSETVAQGTETSVQEGALRERSLNVGEIFEH